ncbi:MAG: hypothetical protein CMN25_13900 [Salinicola sp.]|nr:hypothetical protein [Salinicola sp.]
MRNLVVDLMIVVGDTVGRVCCCYSTSRFARPMSLLSESRSLREENNTFVDKLVLLEKQRSKHALSL